MNDNGEQRPTSGDIMKHYTVDGNCIECPLSEPIEPKEFYIKHCRVFNAKIYPEQPQISMETLRERLTIAWVNMDRQNRKIYETLSNHHNVMRSKHLDEIGLHCAHCYHHDMEKRKKIPSSIPQDAIWSYHCQRVDEGESLKSSWTKYFNDKLYLHERIAENYNRKYQQRLLGETKCIECKVCRE